MIFKEDGIVELKADVSDVATSAPAPAAPPATPEINTHGFAFPNQVRRTGASDRVTGLPVWQPSPSPS